MKQKYYDGYQSFDFLQKGRDYQTYALAKVGDRFGTYHVNLSDRDEARVQRIFEEELIVSLRDHGFIMPQNKEDILPYCRHGYTAYSYEGLAQAGLDTVFENFMDGIMTVSSRAGLKWDDVLWNLGLRYSDIAHQDTLMIATTVFDIYRAKETGRVAVIPSLEAAAVIENEVERLDVLYGLGIRCVGITYNDANTLGSGLAEERDGGLTKLGRKAVERMNRLGMAIDISHSGDQTSKDVIELSEKPVLITHAGARSVWDTPRMKPDDVIKACAEKGGVIGILAAPNTTLSPKYHDHCLEAVMDHFEYIVDLVGIDHVGLGADTFFGDHAALQQAFDDALSLSDSHGGKEKEESDYVRGMEDPIEANRNVIRWLVQKGYTDSEIEKVAGGNIMRALTDIWVK